MRGFLSGQDKVRRVSGNSRLEQFLMDGQSLDELANELMPLVGGEGVVFIGDDDHLSVVLGDITSRSTVLEYDERIRQSIALQSHEIDVRPYDVRNEPPVDIEADIFVANPPYSSKNNGAGIKAWIKRGSQLTRSGGAGIIMMPWEYDADWAQRTRRIVEHFLQQNGMAIIKVLEAKQYYPDANHAGLFSNAIVIDRGQQTIDFEVPQGDALYR